MNFESVFVNPNGRTSRGQFIFALVPLLAAAALYYFLVPIYLSRWMLAVLLIPAFVLHARRLHDIGWTAWLLVIPAALIAVAVALHMTGANSGTQSTATLSAIAVLAGFGICGLVRKGKG
jgi:uncharacterized membrane protein YhaH (DUF805 family)